MTSDPKPNALMAPEVPRWFLTHSPPPSLSAFEKSIADSPAGRLVIPRPLSDEERSYLVRLMRYADDMLAIQVNSIENAAAVMSIVRAFSIGPQDPATIAARAATLEEAVEDLPAWTIVEARRMWAKGEAPKSVEKPDYRYPPAPAQLRACCAHVAGKVRYERRRAERLLSAEVERRHSREHREAMARKLADIKIDTQTTTAAEDGPGGG